jgi:hypothetical protein
LKVKSGIGVLIEKVKNGNIQEKLTLGCYVTMEAQQLSL